jgi:hypothetical protein
MMKSTKFFTPTSHSLLYNNVENSWKKYCFPQYFPQLLRFLVSYCAEKSRNILRFSLKSRKFTVYVKRYYLT